MQKISPFLWFDDKAEEAANFYVSIFKDSKIVDVSRYSKESAMAAGRPEGSVMVVSFDLGGTHFTALNGGPIFKFTEAVSFMVDCEDQAEVDYYWEKLSAGGQESQCGWLKDKYGLSWQIVPRALAKLMSEGDEAQSRRVMGAMLEMQKIDVSALERAARGE